MVGSGSDEDELRAETERLGLGERVSFHGRVPHDSVAPYYARCHAVLCASLGDYRSLTGFEAVNSGRAVLVSSRDGAADELAEAAPESVRVADPLDHAQLVSALRALADPRTLSSALTAAATPPHAFSIDAVGENLASAVRVAQRR